MEFIENNVTDCETLLGPMEVLDLRVDGGAVARHEGKVVFLDNAVPGDIVMARVVRDKKKIIEAEVTECLSPSSHRTTPWCPCFSQCGGCSWQHIGLEYQREWKKRHVEETLRRIGGIDIPVAPILASPKSRGFRTKVSYAFGMVEGMLHLGLKQKKSTTILPVESCGLQVYSIAPVLNAVLQEARSMGLQAWEKGEGYLRYLVAHTPEHEIVNKAGASEKQVVVEIITGPERSGEHAALGKVLEKVAATPGLLTGIVHGERRARSDVAQSERSVASYGEVDILESYGRQALLFPYNGFMQTNTGAAALLYDAVREAAKADFGCVLDMYCGAGAIGLHMADESTILVGVDSQEQSIAYAQKNARNRPEVKARFFCGQAVKGLKHCQEAPDVIVADPPRAGMEEAVILQLAKSAARKLIYVSCDVATQARDVKIFCHAGWNTISAHPVDMFPYTPHVENIVVMEK